MNAEDPVRIPLRDPTAQLEEHEFTRYARQMALAEVGLSGQLRLKRARALVIGAGGLGSPVLVALAAAGVGTIGIADHDAVELSNLPRQTAHTTSAIGRLKVDSAAETIAALNPGIRVQRHPVLIDPANAGALCAGYDIVIDCTDNFAAHYAIADATETAGLPMVWGSVLRFDGMVSVFWPPARPDAPGFRDLFAEDSSDAEESCAAVGVLGTSCAVLGGVMAAEALKLIVGFGQPMIGRVMVLDAAAGSWRHIPLRSGGTSHAARAVPAAAAAPSAATDVQRVREVSVAELAVLIESSIQGAAQHDAELKLLDVQVVDVRESAERASGMIAGALAIPLSRIADAAERGELRRSSPIVLYCELGARSRTAAQTLLAAGYREVSSLAGGMRAWLAVDAEPFH